MHRPLFAALALVCVLALPSHAHPNYPGLVTVKEGQGATGAGFLTRPSARSNRVLIERRLPDPKRAAAKSALAIARRYIGTNPTGWKRLWCAKAMNFFERKAGRSGTGSAAAKSFASYGKGVPLAKARPGDIVVTKRRGGHHVGYLVAKQGKTVRLLSGNSGGAGPGRRVVAEGNYPVSRIIAVRRPSA